MQESAGATAQKSDAATTTRQPTEPLKIVPGPACYKVVFVRHGESEYNQKNLFTGWFDCDLTQKGEDEARDAGRRLLAAKYQFDIVYTSVLKRAVRTMNLLFDELDHHYVAVAKTWRLNERHYGDLQGYNKAEMAAKYGESQVGLWRRSFSIAPPAITRDDSRWPGKDPKYAQMDPRSMPLTESLLITGQRTLPYWFDEVVPAIKSGKQVMLVAHGNSIRAIIKYLDNISDDNIPNLNIPNGLPLVYEMDKDMNAVKHYYLATDEEVEKAIGKVAAQGKAKPAAAAAAQAK